VSPRVVVVGGGAAGCLAAAAARRAGAVVTLVSRSAGATAMSSGAVCLDGMDEPPAGGPVARAALDELARACGLVPTSSSHLLDSGGVLAPGLVARSHARGALDALRERSVLVVGIPGHPDTRASDLSSRLAAAGVRAGSQQVAVPGVRRTFDLPAFALARALDDESTAASWAAAVAEARQHGGWEVIALPPVLGLSRHERVVEVLDEALGDGWFETLASPPSVPGMRLWRNLERYIKIQDVTLLKADVRSVTVRGDTVIVLRAVDGETVHEIEADQVVLATGRFVAGGLDLAGRVVETLLDLPTTEDPGDEEGRLEAGVTTDDELRPVDDRGRVVLANVRVAGDVRAGGAYALGRGGIGRAAALGWAAGTGAAAAAGEAPAGDEERVLEARTRAGDEGCVGCEMCASVCPVLDSAGLAGPWYPGPRGLSGLGRAGPLLAAAGEPLSLCTLCGACSSICPAGSRNPRTVAALRAELLERDPQEAPEPYRALPEVISRSGNVYGAELEPLEGPRRSDALLAFFPGCALSYFERDSGRDTVELLEALDIPLSLVDGVCCGGPLDVLGLDPPASVVEANREAVRRTGAEIVVAACPRCAHRLSADLDLAGVRVEHTLELLDRELPGSAVLPRLRAELEGRVVTYHDPCELGRYRGLYDEARRVLGLVGAQVVEMERTRESSGCCGAGGGLRSVEPRLSRSIARRRVGEALDTGAGHLLTECPSCLHNLRTGRKRKQRIDVADVTALLGSVL
jgi:Fe-S oxidoreductase/anaerobic glycerol-3-phosphate dehydrogenase